MADDTRKSIVVNHAGLQFGFSRDQSDNGYWYCLSNKNTAFGYGIGCKVPTQYWSEIKCSALNQGYDAYLLEYSPPVKLSKSSSRSSTKLFTSKRSSSSPRQKKQKDDGGIKIFV